jgi:magnesium transporter
VAGGSSGTHRGFRPVVRAVSRSRTPTPEPPLEPATHDAVVDWALYRDGLRYPVASYTDAVEVARAGDGFVWIGLHEPDEKSVTEIAASFGLHPLAVEDAVQAHQRPKLERYDDMLFLVLKTVRYWPHASVDEASQIVETGEVMVFVGHHFVVTVRHGEHGGLRQVRRALEQQPRLLALGPSAVLHAVADQIVDTYVDVADLLQDDIDEIEEQIFSARSRRSSIEKIYMVKREVMELRRAVAPLAGPLGALSERDSPLLHEEIREYFRDVEDHLTRARDSIQGYEEILNALIQTYLAQLSISENEDMRRLAAWAAIFAVPTAIAGIYGMNFTNMPELQSRYGYYVVLTVIAAAVIGLFVGFKRSGWL